MLIERICFARPILNKAASTLKEGRIIEAGCWLRESVRLFLRCQCRFHQCMPRMRSRRSPILLLKALNVAGHCHGTSFETLAEIICYCNKAAHCQVVSVGELEACISILRSLMDTATGHRDGEWPGSIEFSNQSWKERVV